MAAGKEGQEPRLDLSEHEDEADSLDWSVSGISAASAFNPDRFHTEYHTQSSASHSAWSSPERRQQKQQQPENRGVGAASQEDLRRLAGQFVNLQSNLEHISRKSVTPINSPRAGKSDGAPNDKNNRANPHSQGTPPVKDPGLKAPASSASSRIVKKLDFHSKAAAAETTDENQFEQMRSTLKELETARQNLTASKIPRLKRNAAKKTVPRLTSSLDEEFKQMNDFLDKVKSSSSEGVSKRLSTDDSGQNSTVVENQKDDAPSELAEEMEKSKVRLEATVAELEKKLSAQSSQMVLLQQSKEQKEALLDDLKSRLSHVMSKWSDNQRELVQELTASREECGRIKLESSAAKDQFKVCQDELSKAVQIASDFRHKLTEEESIKQDMLNELLSERTSKAKRLSVEQAKLLKLSKENEELAKEHSKLAAENSQLTQANMAASRRMAAESARHQDRWSELEKEKKQLEGRLLDLQDERGATESSLHTFYAAQMESIISEKIETLQSNVQHWEKNLVRDKQAALSLLQSQHEAQLENLRRTLFEDVTGEYERQIRDLTASLFASRMEAEALREQLKLETKKSSEASSQAKPNNFSAASEGPAVQGNDGDAQRRQERIWRQILKQAAASEEPNPSKRSIPIVQNNLHEAAPSSQNQRQSSARRRRAPVAAETHSSSEAEEAVSRRSLPPSRRNNANSNNNERPRSANARIRGSIDKVATKRVGNAAAERDRNSLEASSIGMTPEERKEIIKDFVKEYLEENPDAVLNAGLMMGLNKMAAKLVDLSTSSSPPPPPAGKGLSSHANNGVNANSISEEERRMTAASAKANGRSNKIPPNYQNSIGR